MLKEIKIGVENYRRKEKMKGGLKWEGMVSLPDKICQTIWASESLNMGKQPGNWLNAFKTFNFPQFSLGPNPVASKTLKKANAMLQCQM